MPEPLIIKSEIESVKFIFTDPRWLNALKKAVQYFETNDPPYDNIQIKFSQSDSETSCVVESVKITKSIL